MVTSPDYTINVKVVSRYIALGHDTYREPPYRYCIDISPYRLILIVKHVDYFCTCVKNVLWNIVLSVFVFLRAILS